MAAAEPCVLFLCTHDSARSQMAEALLRHHGGGRFAACSADAEPTEVHPLTRRVLEEVGIATEGLRWEEYEAHLRSRLPGFVEARSGVFVRTLAGDVQTVRVELVSTGPILRLRITFAASAT